MVVTASRHHLLARQACLQEGASRDRHCTGTASTLSSRPSAWLDHRQTTSLSTACTPEDDPAGACSLWQPMRCASWQGSACRRGFGVNGTSSTMQDGSWLCKQATGAASVYSCKKCYLGCTIWICTCCSKGCLAAASVPQHASHRQAAGLTLFSRSVLGGAIWTWMRLILAFCMQVGPPEDFGSLVVKRHALHLLCVVHCSPQLGDHLDSFRSRLQAGQLTSADIRLTQ